MAILVGVFNPRKKLQGLCAIPECEHEISGMMPESFAVLKGFPGGQLLCQEHLDEFAEREVARIQES